MKISILLVIFAIAVVCFMLGFSIGKHRHNYTGSIVLDKNEDGDDRITFNLGMEYDDIAKHEELIFKVVK